MSRVFCVFGLVILIGLSLSRPAHACACCDTHRVVGVASNDVLNIRSGPGTRYRIIGGIEANASCVIVTGPCKRNWCKASYIDQEGWVYMNYLKFQSQPQ